MWEIYYVSPASFLGVLSGAMMPLFLEVVNRREDRTRAVRFDEEVVLRDQAGTIMETTQRCVE